MQTLLSWFGPEEHRGAQLQWFPLERGNEQRRSALEEDSEMLDIVVGPFGKHSLTAEGGLNVPARRPAVRCGFVTRQHW
jgi:hypothetical protein